MKRLMIATTCCSLLLACGGEPRAGQPETGTTGTVQAASQTTPEAATTTGASGGTVSDLPPEEKEFVANAGMVGLAEVQMGTLLLEKGVSGNVRAFAQTMVDDHSASNAELAHLATAKGLALPTELGGDSAAALEHLQSLSGGELDRAYMQHMVADHETAVAMFDRASTSATDPDIKAYAVKNLPILRQHLAEAKDVARRM